MEGFLLIDKPKGITSFDVVRQVRRITGEKKVGHGGTLDPLATGLLIVALGKATKKLGELLGSDKEYEVLACFGGVSDTYDADGRITFSVGKSDSIYSSYYSLLIYSRICHSVSYQTKFWTIGKICFN